MQTVQDRIAEHLWRRVREQRAALQEATGGRGLAVIPPDGLVVAVAADVDRHNAAVRDLEREEAELDEQTAMLPVLSSDLAGAETARRADALRRARFDLLQRRLKLTEGKGDLLDILESQADLAAQQAGAALTDGDGYGPAEAALTEAARQMARIREARQFVIPDAFAVARILGQTWERLIGHLL